MSGTLTIVVVPFIICHIEGLDIDLVVIALFRMEGCTGDETSSNEGERDMTVFLVVLARGGGPEVLVMTLSGDEFLLKWHSVGWIRKDSEGSKASSQSGLAVEPLMMNDSQGTVTAIDFGNDEQLVALTHGGCGCGCG